MSGWVLLQKIYTLHRLGGVFYSGVGGVYGRGACEYLLGGPALKCFRVAVKVEDVRWTRRSVLSIASLTHSSARRISSTNCAIGKSFTQHLLSESLGLSLIAKG